MKGRQNTQHKDIQHNGIQHNGTQHEGLICDTLNKRHSILTTVQKKRLSNYAECRNADCRYAECRGAKRIASAVSLFKENNGNAVC